jgi:hypothetical protein
MTDMRGHSICKRLAVLALLVCGSHALVGQAQDAAGQVEQFLNAFRGKAIGPMTPQPTQMPQNQNGATGDNSAATQPQTPSTVVQPDSAANTSSCPPGVDRLGCPSPSRKPYPTYCPPGTTSGPNGCAPMAMPANAHRVSDDGQWQCDEGYLRYGSICIPIQSSPPR